MASPADAAWPRFLQQSLSAKHIASEIFLSLHRPPSFVFFASLNIAEAENNNFFKLLGAYLIALCQPLHGYYQPELDRL